MDARFKSNLDMIGRNEPITRKAKFWQSYVRALKGEKDFCLRLKYTGCDLIISCSKWGYFSTKQTGTDDIRAPEHTHRPRSIFRSEFPELHSTSWPFGKSIFENPIHAADRINVPGYRCVSIYAFIVRSSSQKQSNDSSTSRRSNLSASLLYSHSLFYISRKG